MSVIMVIFVLYLLAPNDERRNFSWHQKDLKVPMTILVQSNGQLDYWLTGIVTNQDSHPWRAHSLEVRFVDAQNHLVDVRHVKIENDCVVQSHGDHGFRAEMRGLVLTNLGRQVRIEAASDADQRPKSDEP